MGTFVIKDPASPATSDVSLRFINAEAVRPSGVAPLSGRIHYLRGADARKWIRDVPTYARPRYEHVYRGIDLVFYGADRQLEYDVIVAPHADPSRIALAFEGADSVRVTSDGDLVVASGEREIIQKRPVAFQERDGRRTMVDVHYSLAENRVLSLRVGSYTTRKRAWRLNSTGPETTSGTSLILEDCLNCGVQGWGWSDNGYGTPGALVRFAAAGRHTLRLQAREDGLSIDQVVLSNARYLTAPPGRTKDDTTVLKRTPVSASTDLCSGAAIVLHVGNVGVHPGWTPELDSSAAGGTRLFNPDGGTPKLTTALASPPSYFRVAFTADGGTDYRLWFRGVAQNDYWANDSVFVQFSDSVNSSDAPAWRIGTTSATTVNLEDCPGCGLRGWGWQDNGWGTGAMGPLVRFAAGGTHTIQVQPREDGFSIDQIVLSSVKYLTTAPGTLKSDATILPDCAGR